MIEIKERGPATFLDTQLLIKIERIRHHDEQYSRFVEILKKLYINVPFFDATQVPTYAKYIKDILQNKKPLAAGEVVKMVQEGSEAINNIAL